MRTYVRICACVYMSALLLTLATPSVAVAQSEATASGDWDFVLTPFLWGSGMSGTIGIAAQEEEFEASVEQLLESLDFGLMANFEGRNERWVFSFDFVYTNLGKDVTLAGPLGDEVPATLDMQMAIVEGDFGYRISDHVDVFAGVRGVNTPVSVTTDSGISRDADGGFVDPIFGARVRTDLTEKLWVNLRGDIGGFGVGSDFSWYLGAALGYRVSHLISLGFGYRAWSFDYESDADLKRLDATLAGFAFGAAFHL